MSFNRLFRLVVTAAVFLIASSWYSIFQMIHIRRRTRVEPVFPDSVRSELRKISVTRHSESGPEVTSGDDYRIIKHNPDGNDSLGQLRQYLRDSQGVGYSSSRNSLGWSARNRSRESQPSRRRWSTPSTLSFQGSVADEPDESDDSDDSDEGHEGVIEFPAKGKTRNFLDPITGELIHLAQWKSTRDEEEIDDKDVSRGEVKQAFARMAAGATAIAGSKDITDTFFEELEKWADREDEAEPPAQRAGGSMAGLSNNSQPCGWPQMV